MIVVDTSEITVERNGRQYGATYTVSDGMLHLKTHTETRSVEVGEQDPETLARGALIEIVDSQSKP
jgi:hypothetical protein